ncbi:glycosyltransferase family 4 protein [Magnetospirillum moscoviense]|uniref:Glycosyl transferase family 1 domain-containing protein n=1 Tax=Magnetospirillum moscoviense TaxID=1437059 RepID=A0A178MYS3_9PROT|nr:glycosyltransferase family 4 protein [Magnetospirillum moscoviense]OAN55098.1 hypothetical protein A6A05_00625 [Magnetospirillum moscoviense]
MRQAPDPQRAETARMKVCFVVPYSYTLFNPETNFPFGGMEVQAHMIATTLAKRPGFDVRFVVFNHGQPARQLIDGIQLISYPRQRVQRSAAKPMWSLLPQWKGHGRVIALSHRKSTRPLYHAIMAIQEAIDRVRALPTAIRLYRQWARTENHLAFLASPYCQSPWRISTYRQIDADIFVGFGASELMAELAAFCEITDKRFVLFGASDSDFDPQYIPHSSIRNYYGCRAGHCHFCITTADRIIVQNKVQQAAAMEYFGRHSRVIVNPINLSLRGGDLPARQERKQILWIGKADMVKRPLLAIEVARACPDLDFLLVVNPNRPEVEEQLAKGKPANVTIIPHLKRHDVPVEVERSLLLLNTSRFEGFPNVFLEAFRAGTPVASLAVDPDGVLSEHGCGVCAGNDLQALIRQIRHLATDVQAWESCSAAALAYVASTHDVEHVTDQVIEVLEDVESSRTTARPTAVEPPSPFTST